MTKPLSLNSLTFSDTKGNTIIVEDYTVTFKDDIALEKYINDRYEYWKKLLDMELVFAQDSGETLDELGVRKTLRLTAKFLGLDYKRVSSKSRKSEYIEARRMAIAICVDRKTRLRTIGKAMNMHHANVMHHRDTFRNLCETDKAYKDKFEDLEDYLATMIKLNGIES